MTAEEILKASERSALENNQFASHVTGKTTMQMKKSGKWKSWGAMGFITAILVVVAALFGSGNLIPSAISERLIEETDAQYADAVESKKIVFQQAMKQGELPDDTVEILKQHGIETEKTENGELILKKGDKIITASNFVSAVDSDVELYNAFNDATYSRAAYYYDESAQKVFKEIGTTRNNYTAESDFDTVMSDLMGKGSKVSVNNVGTTENNGKTEYVASGATAQSSSGAKGFIDGVAAQNTAGSGVEATLNSADSLKVADTISKEQRSSLFYLGFMENISKMKAGEGNDSKINEAMNYLYETHETETVDVKTGEVVKVKGSALESPSLYAILAGTKVNVGEVENYSSDRVLKTIKNKVGGGDSAKAIEGTVASSKSGVQGVIGRLLSGGEATASKEALGSVEKTIDSSLVNNSYETVKGVDAGELLVEGAVNVGRKLALKSGATAGDAAAVSEYARLNSTILAMDAAADRMNRSPFDATSKNTFLGSIIYKLAVASSGFSGSLASGVKSISSAVSEATLSLLPSSYADAAEGYLTQFGDCETYATIGAVGSAQCASEATFDTSTLDGIYEDSGFINFIEKNTTLSASGKRTIIQGSELANFELYNSERITPLGVVDGGILESLQSESSSVSFVSNVVGMIAGFLGASEDNKKIASGAMFVNSSNNPNWQTYKYAQRYMSLARAVESLRRYSGGSSAYNNIYGFEGDENPVIAFINNYYQTAQR